MAWRALKEYWKCAAVHSLTDSRRDGVSMPISLRERQDIMNVLRVAKTAKEYKMTFGYHARMVECVKRIPSSRYDAKSRAWTCPSAQSWYVDKFMAWAKQYGYVQRVDVVDMDADIIDLPEIAMPTLDVPHGMLMEPYPYQREGIAYALQSKRCIFGDEPGLGKTMQAIGTVFIAKAWPALVICPSSLKENWRREFKKFAGVEAIILDDANKGTWQRYWEMKKSNGDAMASVFITNYESLKKFFVQSISDSSRFTIRSIKFDPRIDLFRSVIVDESHKCKSAKTKQSKFVQGICRGKEYILMLTGTPVVNNNTDLIQQLNIMERLEDFGGYSKFAARYCEGYNQSSHSKELNALLKRYCFFRRQKKDVLTQLPDKTRTYLVVDITNRKEYQDAEADLVKYLREYKQATDDEIMKSLRGEVMVRMSILKQIAARGKIEAAREIVEDITEGGQKIIVFGFLKDVIAGLKETFPKAVTVTGEDNDKAKQMAVDKFQGDEGTKVILLNYRSGGTGLTLTASSDVLFVEFPWTYADCCQAEDRAHRNGQKNAVTCRYLLGRGTIDEYMYKIVQNKKEVANAVTGTDNVVAERKVSREEEMLQMAMDMFGGKL